MQTRMEAGRTTGGRGTVHRWYWLLVGVLVMGGLLLVGCEDGSLDEDGVEMPTNALEVTITDDGIEPDTQEVRVPDRYQLIVNNESEEDCLFDLSTYVRNLEVAAGETGQIDVQLPPVEVDGAELEMGCRDDEERTGTLIVLNATGTDLGE